MKFLTGIDDIGTGTSKSEGWGFFVLPADRASEFTKGARDIIDRTKLSAFHGKDFKRRFRSEYIEFLKLAVNSLEESTQCLLAVTLLNESWKKEYNSFCERQIENSYGINKLNNQVLNDASKKLSKPLFTLQRFTSEMGSTNDMLVEIDSDAVLKQLNGLNFQFKGVNIEAELPIRAFYNGYRKNVFPRSPALEKNGLTCQRDEDSFLIQVADIVGNFSTAFIFTELGKKSKTIELKRNIFLEVFSDMFEFPTFKDSIKISGDDIILREDGAFTLAISK